VYEEPSENLFVPEYAAKYPDIAGMVFPRCCRSVPGEVYQYIREFFAVYPKDRLSALGFFLLALSRILNAGTQRARSANILFRAKSLIDREFDDPSVSAGTVAEHCGITVNYLNRLFRETLGVSTTEYLLSRRLEYAETMLADSGKTIKEISGDCGFNDHNYFSRLFRKKKGLSPGELRRGSRISPGDSSV
jgi:two-component system response regulator YesN